jgi:hypothetical protein
LFALQDGSTKLEKRKDKLCEIFFRDTFRRRASTGYLGRSRKPLEMSGEVEDTENAEEQAPIQVFAVESSTGLVYPIYSNDSGCLIAKHSIMEEWFKFADEAASANMAEHFASIRIQSSVRHKICRIDYSRTRRAQITLSRTYRGHRGRLEYVETQDMDFARLRREFWDNTAMVIQKIYRGYFSRKNIHNFYLRKSYLETIAGKGEGVRRELSHHFIAMQTEAQNRQAEARIDEFEKVVGNLHHMLSTASCRGVYNSPYHQPTQATMFGLPVEEHLRNVARGTLRMTLGRVRAETMSSQASGTPGYAAGTARDDADGFYAFATKPAKISRAH